MSNLSAALDVAAAHQWPPDVLKRIFGGYLFFTASIMWRAAVDH